ncbi:CBS domain-containing protein [Kitasatospora sp. NPDC004240]
MTTARDIMHAGAQCITPDQTLTEASKMMRDMGVGALPICDTDGKLKGIITDRDIVVKCLAKGKDPSTMKVMDLASHPHFVRAHDGMDAVIKKMEQHQIHRMPVIDNGHLVGMISEADLAMGHREGQRLTDRQIIEFMDSVFAPVGAHSVSMPPGPATHPVTEPGATPDAAGAPGEPTRPSLESQPGSTSGAEKAPEDPTHAASHPGPPPSPLAPAPESAGPPAERSAGGAVGGSTGRRHRPWRRTRKDAQADRHPTEPPRPQAPSPPASRLVVPSQPATREAYARLDAPERVDPGEVFALLVGLAPAPSARIESPVPLTVPADPFRLGVQLFAPGFEVVGDAPLTLELDAGPADPYPFDLRRLRAVDDPALAAARTITAVYSVAGALIGVATVTVQVGPAVPQTQATPPGGAWVLPDDPAAQPDLEIVVAPGNDAAGNTHLWAFRSPHLDVRPPAEPLRTVLSGEESFSDRVRQGVEDHADAPDLARYLRGLGRTIGSTIPTEVWDAIAAVTVHADPPTVLLATKDPDIPWELAALPGDWKSWHARYLGARVTIGRWLYGQGLRTPAPPARLTAGTMAVVSGHYPANPLAEALAEATTLAEDYRATQIEALTEPLLDCLERPPAPEILHLAVHGNFDRTGTADGILMTDDRYLDPNSVLGVTTGPEGTIGVRLLFLNACQLGQQQRLLGRTTGIVPSFLALGVGAAVAPLWKIDDQVARRLAEGFYAAVLRRGIAPAEHLRQWHVAASGEDGERLATPLAYLFFGHPRLTIDWAPRGADHA